MFDLVQKRRNRKMFGGESSSELLSHASSTINILLFESDL